eukprot:gene11413-biopygen9096
MEQKSFKELKDVGRKGFVAELVNPFRIISRTECVEEEDLEMDLGSSAKFESQPLHSTPPNMFESSGKREKGDEQPGCSTWPTTAFEQQMIDPKIMARALAIAMEQARQKGTEEPKTVVSYQSSIEYDTAKILKYHIDELKQYMKGAEMPSKIKKLICREHCLFLHRENQQRCRGEKHEFYPSSVLKKQLACHLVSRFPDMADSDGGCHSLFHTKPRQGGSIVKCLEHINNKLVIPKEKRVKKKSVGKRKEGVRPEGQADVFAENVETLQHMTCGDPRVQSFMEATFVDRRAYIETKDSKAPTIVDILNKFHVLTKQAEIEMEFERMHPGASDAEFRKMFAKIAEAANVQHDDDLASLSSAILPKRCKKQLVERVESVQAMAEKNPALTIVKDIRCCENGKVPVEYKCWYKLRDKSISSAYKELDYLYELVSQVSFRGIMELEIISKMKVDELKDFLRLRGLKVSGRKEELIARVFVAHENNVPLVKSAEEVQQEVAMEYANKLQVEDETLPDPFQLQDGWIKEEDGDQIESASST